MDTQYSLVSAGRVHFLDPLGRLPAALATRLVEVVGVACRIEQLHPRVHHRSAGGAVNKIEKIGGNKVIGVI